MDYEPAMRPRTRAPQRVAAIFARLLRIAQRQAPGLRSVLREGDVRAFPEPRNHAYCSDGKDGITVVVAPRMASAARSRIEGVLMHELAHAVFFLHGEPRHAEREADLLAEHLFGRVIRYDADTVQTTGKGIAPRPAHLPA